MKKTYNLAEYQVYFQWDSVFQPEFHLDDLKEVNGKITVTTEITSKRYIFLANNPLITQQQISFKKGRITQIETLEYKNVNWNTWTSRRDSLVNWINQNKPELSGFIHDMTRQGAENYLKAIELYKNR